VALCAQRVDCAGREDNTIERLAGGDALRRIDTSDRFDQNLRVG